MAGVTGVMPLMDPDEDRRTLPRGGRSAMHNPNIHGSRVSRYFLLLLALMVFITSKKKQLIQTLL